MKSCCRDHGLFLISVHVPARTGFRYIVLIHWAWNEVTGFHTIEGKINITASVCAGFAAKVVLRHYVDVIFAMMALSVCNECTK